MVFEEEDAQAVREYATLRFWQADTQRLRIDGRFAFGLDTLDRFSPDRAGSMRSG